MNKWGKFRGEMKESKPENDIKEFAFSKRFGAELIFVLLVVVNALMEKI